MLLLYRVLRKEYSPQRRSSQIMCLISTNSMKRLFKRIFYRLIPYCFLYPFFKIFGRLEVKGIENLSEKEGILIASNHLSYVDPPLLATVVPGGCVFMAKHELFNITLLRHLIGYYAFPVNRQKPSASAIKTALAKLSTGDKIVIFPEGRRNTGAALLPPKSGIGMITLLSKKKVVPTLILGTDTLFRLDKLMPRPARVRVIFGKPLDLSREGTDYTRISNLIMENIRNMDK